MPPTLLCVAPQTANPVGESAAVTVGLNPPWNQPHVMPLRFSRSPTFVPSMAPRLKVDVWLVSAQSSHAGSGSLMTVPTPAPFGDCTTKGSDVMVCVTELTATMPCVLPEIRFTAPGVDGPNTVSNELSLIA